jgi:hypothetical protein
VAWTAWTLLSVRSDAEAARRDLRATRDDLDVESLLDGDGLTTLERAAARFDALGGRLDHPLLAPVRALPVAGRQLAAADDQVGAAADGLRSAADVGGSLRDLVDGGLGAGPERVTTLREISSVAEAGRARFAALDLGPDEALLGVLSSARAEIEEAQQEAIDGLERAATMSSGLAVMFEGPSDYLLVAANNAQMQNGQGMFLSGGVLHIEDGRLDLGPMASLEKVPVVDPPVPLEPDLAARWGWLDPNDDFRHLGLTHRFPVTGALAADLWSALGNPEVDGVVAVDPLVLEAIMATTGPVSTPGGERRAEDVVEFILHDQYQGYLVGDDDRSYTSERRDELDALATAALDAFEQVTELEASFLDRFRRAAAGRHLLMWSSDPAVQAGFEAARVDGQMGPDALLLSLVNRSGVKLDWFMDLEADLALEPDGEGGWEAELAVTVTNRAPSDGEPRYVVGPYPGSGLERGEYLGLVTLNLPAGALDSRFDDVEQLAVSGADGDNRTIAAWLEVPRGTSETLVARFRLPATTSLVVEPSGRALATTWSFDGTTWTDEERRTLELADQ